MYKELTLGLWPFASPGRASIGCWMPATNEEQLLWGGTHGPVVRVGDTVRRQPRRSTGAVFALLRQL